MNTQETYLREGSGSLQVECIYISSLVHLYWRKSKRCNVMTLYTALSKNKISEKLKEISVE